MATFRVNRAIIERCPFSATGLAVSSIVYDEAGGAFGTPAINEIGATGVYWGTFTPDAEGDWTFYFYCAATGERHTYHYPVYDYKTIAGVKQVLEVSVTAAANSGISTVATVGTQPCIIEGIVIHADTAQTGDMTTCAVEGGVGQVITFIGVGDAIQANLDAADKQVWWLGIVRLAVGKIIYIDLQGTGATAVDLTVTITYRACVDGGVLT